MSCAHKAQRCGSFHTELAQASQPWSHRGVMPRSPSSFPRTFLAFLARAIAASPGLLGQPFVYATNNNKPPSGCLSGCLPAPLDSEDRAWLILKLCPMWASLNTHHLLHKTRASRHSQPRLSRGSTWPGTPL